MKNDISRIKQWKIDNPEKWQESRKRGRVAWKKRQLTKPTAVAAKKAYDRAYNFKRKYGMSMDDFESLLAMQNGACAICSGRPKSTGLFHVDHDHATGKVRGILCQRCNMSLGGFSDSADLLTMAIHYLKGVQG